MTCAWDFMRKVYVHESQDQYNLSCGHNFCYFFKLWAYFLFLLNHGPSLVVFF